MAKSENEEQQDGKERWELVAYKAQIRPQSRSCPSSQVIEERVIELVLGQAASTA